MELFLTATAVLLSHCCCDLAVVDDLSSWTLGFLSPS